MPLENTPPTIFPKIISVIFTTSLSGKFGSWSSLLMLLRTWLKQNRCYFWLNILFTGIQGNIEHAFHWHPSHQTLLQCKWHWSIRPHVVDDDELLLEGDLVWWWLWMLSFFESTAILPVGNLHLWPSFWPSLHQFKWLHNLARTHHSWDFFGYCMT